MALGSGERFNWADWISHQSYHGPTSWRLHLWGWKGTQWSSDEGLKRLKHYLCYLVMVEIWHLPNCLISNSRTQYISTKGIPSWNFHVRSWNIVIDTNMRVCLRRKTQIIGDKTMWIAWQYTSLIYSPPTNFIPLVCLNVCCLNSCSWEVQSIRNVSCNNYYCRLLSNLTGKR